MMQMSLISNLGANMLYQAVIRATALISLIGSFYLCGLFFYFSNRTTARVNVKNQQWEYYSYPKSKLNWILMELTIVVLCFMSCAIFWWSAGQWG